MVTTLGYDPEDDEPWVDNPIYQLMLSEVWKEEVEVPIVDKRIELTEFNTCPCCNGKGFVKVIRR